MEMLVNSFAKEAELWHRPKDKTKLAVVDSLPSDESDFLAKFYSQFFQKSPLGWAATGKPHRYSTRQAAREKAHRMGYTEKIVNQ